ncbi:MAG: glycosyltransferase family 2 protein [Verrucomicrobiota bacterium]
MEISLCVITLNEEENLDRCLESAAALVDEMVVLDSGSTDGTQGIAIGHGARWESKEWQGYVDQKNAVLDLAQHDWILLMDADECLSSALAQELQELKRELEDSLHAGYSMPRCTFYEGRWIRHGDWYPDRLVRLFRKGSARFEGGKVHERLEVKGTVGRLESDLEHFSYRDAKDHKERAGKYARLWAETAFENGKKGGVFPAASHAAYRWVRSYLLRGGFLDGKPGWKIAGISAREVFRKYRLLAEIGKSYRKGG